MILLCLSFFISLLTGFFPTFVIPVWQKKSYFHLLLQLCLAVGLGFGISSSFYFLHLFFGPSLTRLAIMESAALLVSMLFLRFRSSTDPMITFDPETPATNSVYSKILLAGFSCTLTMALLTFLHASLILPCGGWDAWQTWNLFARFFFRGGDHWRDTFTTLLDPHHPDYPLLIPAAIARSWQYIGNETQIVPIITAGLFTFATIGLLFSSLWVLKNKSQALLAGIVLAGTPNFILLGSQQYADTPLGFFFLATLVLCSFQDRMPGNPKISFLAGMMAGFSCWTKNEGLLFILSLILAQIVVFTIFNTRNRCIRSMVSLFAGAIPIMVLVLFFKLNLAPANDILSRQEFHQTILKLTSLSRYFLIMKSFLLTTLKVSPMVILTVIYVLYLKSSFDYKEKRTFVLLPLTLLLMLAGYFLVYVITPFDLDWHLDTSFPRLLMQLWPSIVFSFFLIARTPEEALAGTGKDTGPTLS